MSLFPNPVYMNQFESFLYPNQGGNTSITLFEPGEEAVKMRYFLGGEVSNSNAGFSLKTAQNRGVLDLSYYDSMKLKIAVPQEMSITIELRTFMNDDSKISDYFSLRPFAKTIHVKPGREWYEIPLDEFASEDWWLKGNKKPLQYEQNEAMQYFVSLWVKDGQNPKDQSYTYDIEDISFHKSYNLLYIVLGVVLLFYIIGLAVWWTRLNKRMNDPTSLLGHNTVDLDYYGEKTLNDAIHMVQSQHSDLESLIPNIGKNRESRVPQALITGLVREKIIMNEAKRLLIETDHSIQEVAELLGYKNTLYFSMLFKQLEGHAPEEYKK